MRIHHWHTILTLALISLGVALMIIPSGSVSAQEGILFEDAVLAQMYAPVLYFYPTEVFRPQPVEVMVNSARLHKHNPLVFRHQRASRRLYR